MRILWIKSDFPLPADTGGKIRSKCLLFELAKLCEVTFLSYIPSSYDNKWKDQMRAAKILVESVEFDEENKQGLGFLVRVFRGLTSKRPYIVNKYISKEMIATITRILANNDFDTVICDFLEMAWCAEFITDLPVVLFAHNVETMIWRRYYQVEENPLRKLYFAYEKRRMAWFEREACKKFDLVLTVSDNDGRILIEQFGAKRTFTIPTGVDIGYFQPQSGEQKANLVFCGSMDWMPNIDGFWWFYRMIYPQIRKKIPEITFTVVGRRPVPQIVAAGKEDEALRVTGTVADVRPAIGGGQIYVVPLRVGGGTRIKIYEALAMKKCVVSTSIGAEGLPLTNGENIVIADSEKDFANSVIELLCDDDKRSKIADNGYRLVTEKYGWQHAAALLYKGLRSTTS